MMYRQTQDFLADWNNAAKGAKKSIEAITEEKKTVAITEGHNSLEWLAWHLVEVGTTFGKWAGFNMPTPDEKPDTLIEIAKVYEDVAHVFEQQITDLQDADLENMVPAFGSAMPLGNLLRILITHQTHHVGQMTVLLRQAGLKVPPVMGPTKEMM
ncbi:DinB family protein [Lysinibacillus alkalisoli]|nr:DinB family protein [Lysinibacillus alkalisoli]